MNKQINNMCLAVSAGILLNRNYKKRNNLPEGVLE